MSASPDYYDRGIKKNLFQFLWHQGRFRLIKKLLPKQNSRLLDVGCHGGTFTDQISKVLPDAEIFGIDIDGKAIAYAQKKRPKFHFQVGSAEKIPFPSDYFNLITCLEVLEHVANPSLVIKELRRCLKKNGLLITLVPSESFLFCLIWFFWSRLGPAKVWRGAHLQNFNGTRLDRLLKLEGFAIKEARFSHLGMLRAIKAEKK